MFFFIDETWQTLGNSQKVGALGAVALPQQSYNDFCSAIYRIKKELLGAEELWDSEIKGTRCFSRAAFKRQSLHGDSHWLAVADKVFEKLAAFHAHVFVIWTTHPGLLDLRNPHSTTLSEPYKQLLFDMRGLMQHGAPSKLGSLNFDLRGTREDERTAAALQNYMVRTRGDWRDHFVQVPNFTVSSVSPGLQAADMISFLGPHLSPASDRPELRAYVGRLIGLRYEFPRGSTGRMARTIRRVR
ncbi:MAG TPA: DUF3800 domain-containing protein [Solirubrobacterales bacterium]|nr:DUF3800 domain-containing protein [Solirubrobacterales bacterium]